MVPCPRNLPGWLIGALHSFATPSFQCIIKTDKGTFLVFRRYSEFRELFDQLSRVRRCLGASLAYSRPLAPSPPFRPLLPLFPSRVPAPSL